MGRRLALTKRVSLDGFADGWGSDCYAVVLQAGYAEYSDFLERDTTAMTKLEQMRFQFDFVKERLVGGKVIILDTDTSKQRLDDLQKDDIEGSLDLCNRLFAEIAGVKFDPKVGTTAQLNESEPDESESSTATS